MAKSVSIISPEEIHKLAKDKGWWQTHREWPELLVLMHSELSEALEGYRKCLNPGERGSIGEELADCIIRIFDACEYYGIDIIEEIKHKHEYNKSRPYRHGNKRA